MKVYLDTCCFNRPFDNLNSDIVQMESEAVLTIIDRCSRGLWELWLSDILLREIYAIPDLARQKKVLLLCRAAEDNIKVSESIRDRAKELAQLGIKTFDALHLASAEEGKMDIFLTTDRRFLNAAKRTNIKIKVSNPLIWLMEVLYDER